MTENIIKISLDHSQSLSNTYLKIFQGELTLLEKPMCKQNKAFFLDCFYLLSMPMCYKWTESHQGHTLHVAATQTQQHTTVMCGSTKWWNLSHRSCLILQQRKFSFTHPLRYEMWWCADEDKQVLLAETCKMCRIIMQLSTHIVCLNHIFSKWYGQICGKSFHCWKGLI